MATKKNIIVGAARVFLGPPTDGTTFTIANSKPAYVAGTRFATTLGASTLNTTGVGGDGTTGTDVNNWRDVGYTMEGFTWATDPSWQDVQVDQILDAAKIFKDGMTATASTTFAEATLDNLLVAWGQASTSLSSSGTTDKELILQGGALGAQPLERGLIACGNGVENSANSNYSERVYQAYRAINVEGTSLVAARSQATGIAVSFRCLPASTGDYGTLRDRKDVT